MYTSTLAEAIRSQPCAMGIETRGAVLDIFCLEMLLRASVYKIIYLQYPRALL